MFNEYKCAFKDCADLVSGWDELSLTQLFDKYIETSNCGSQEANSYFSAIMYRAWDKVEMLYHTTKFDFLDCYNIVVDSVLYIAKAHVWTDKSSKLYNDPDAAKIALNVTTKSKKVGLYERRNRSTKRADEEALSLDELMEIKRDQINSSGGILSDRELVTDFVLSDDYVYDDLVKEMFGKGNYFAAVLIDLLSQGYGFENKPFSKHAEGYNKMMLKSELMHLSNQYCMYFSKRYSVKYDEVLRGVELISNCTSNRVDRNIHFTLRMLKNKYFKDMEDCLYEG